MWINALKLPDYRPIEVNTTTLAWFSMLISRLPRPLAKGAAWE